MRYLAISTNAPVEICEYPDSCKFLAYAPDPSGNRELPRQFRRMTRDGEDVNYWEGE